MTKEEAIKMMQGIADEEQGVVGFMVVSMTSLDIGCYCDEKVCERYRKLTKAQKARFLAMLTDSMSNKFEDDSEWTACKLMYDTRDAIEDYNGVEDGLTYLMDEAEKESDDGNKDDGQRLCEQHG